MKLKNAVVSVRTAPIMMMARSPGPRPKTVDDVFEVGADDESDAGVVALPNRGNPCCWANVVAARRAQAKRRSMKQRGLLWFRILLKQTTKLK